MKRIYRYFHVKDGKVVGKLISTFRIKADDMIEITEHNEHLFDLPPEHLIIENGKVIILDNDKLKK